MSQAVITLAFEQYLNNQLVSQEPVVLDEIVLAYLPELDINAPIDRTSSLPQTRHIKHRHPIDQVRKINTNAVVYSIVMDTKVGDFEFNALYLVNSATDMVAMIIHKETEEKIKNQGQTQGNSIVKSMLMQYEGAAHATQVNVSAATWQIDFSARLTGQDQLLQHHARDYYGAAAFDGSALSVSAKGVNTYTVIPGYCYIGGHRAELSDAHTITINTKPSTIYADVYYAGDLLSQWQAHLEIVAKSGTTPLKNYTDGGGYLHYVTPLARIEVNGAITDLRGRGGLWWHENKPHAHTKEQVELGNVDNFKTASKEQAEAAKANNVFMTPRRVKEALERLVPPPFPAGTRMLFQQSTAPPGWTKETAKYNNHALRVVTGTAGNGGEMDFTSVFDGNRHTTGAGEHKHEILVDNHTLTEAQIPPHKHIHGEIHQRTNSYGVSGVRSGTEYFKNGSHGSRNNPYTSTIGGGKPHNHEASSKSTGKHHHLLNMDVKYVDIIIATKQ